MPKFGRCDKRIQEVPRKPILFRGGQLFYCIWVSTSVDRDRGLPRPHPGQDTPTMQISSRTPFEHWAELGIVARSLQSQKSGVFGFPHERGRTRHSGTGRSLRGFQLALIGSTDSYISLFLLPLVQRRLRQAFVLAAAVFPKAIPAANRIQ
jgi:hypothetical protein